jgi:hypothetical protein
VAEGIGVSGLEQLLADRLPAHQPGDPAQYFHVGAGRRLRADDEKEQPHRLAVDGVERHRPRRHSSHHRQLADGRRAGVGNGDTESDPSAQHRFALQHRAQHLLVLCSGQLGQPPRERCDGGLSVVGGERDHHPVRREQLGQEHGVTWRCMGQT